MVDDSRSGRHRTPARYNPVAELSTIVKSAGETSVKATAVLAASGGLVTSFALPGQASTSQAAASTSTTVASVATDTAQAAPRTLSLAPAVVAPAAASPVAVEAIGVAGVKAVAKPKPKPAPVPDRTTTTAAASRSTQRSTANVPQSSSQVVNIARTLLGIPYVYGGEDPSGFDCSGFTQYVFGKAGISIPRTASAQQDAATPVSNPQPGDLVFYGSPAWHVGIYTGNGMMIDSPREGKSTSERPMFDGVTGYGRF
ncbi:MAG TPA: NlpC/P60 family protein [Ornithinibacter sp.]|nr:NlpC/P60 family protein [Ornithinibacter sp.]